MTVKPASNTERVAKLRAEAKRKGWKRREYYASPAEHSELKQHLKKIRNADK